MPDYGFVHTGKVLTPDQTTGISPAENTTRNQALEAAELTAWQAQPDHMFAYYDERKGTITTWPGTVIGTITSHAIHCHNFGGRFITLRMTGTNGARYYGRASYDWSSCVHLHKAKR